MSGATTPVPTVLRSWRARVAGVAALAVGCGLLTLLPGAAPTASAAGLVAWADCDELLEHYRRGLSRAASPYGLVDGGFAVQERASMSLDSTAALAAPAAAGAESATGGAVGTGPTGTNLQEQGVDEPDTVKLADDLLVAVAGGRLQVLQAGTSPSLLSSLPLGVRFAEQEQVSRAELLVDGSRVLVVTSAWRQAQPPDVLGPSGVLGEPASPTVTTDSWRSTLAAGEPVVRLLLVDLAEPRTPRVLESLELDGGYVSARLVDGTVRLVTTSTPQVVGAVPAEPYGPAQEQAALQHNRRAAAGATLDQVLPTAVRRGADGRELSREPAVDCTSVRHAASAPSGVSTLVVTTLRPASGLAAVDRTAVTTDGDLVYASPSRLYVATSRWGTVGPAPDGSAPAADEVTTHVHAFDTSEPGRTPYVGSGAVPGYVSGRWALSEHEGHLRVATTSQPPWDGSGGPSSSSVVVLAEQEDRLVERGRLDGLGLDERIYAVRYFGDLATVVTFRETDPLYVLDLSDPTRPRQLGELKVPGFSTYLHPVGDDRLLGVGQDADASGRVTGFQLSLFDLTDLSAPTQLHRLSLGEGWSPASDDSRAFAYDPGRRLALLPVTSWDQSTGASTSSALSVRVTEDQLVQAGRLTVRGQDVVERVLPGADVTYAVTTRGVVATDPQSLTPTGSADFAGA